MNCYQKESKKKKLNLRIVRRFLFSAFSSSFSIYAFTRFFFPSYNPSPLYRTKKTFRNFLSEAKQRVYNFIFLSRLNRYRYSTRSRSFLYENETCVYTRPTPTGLRHGLNLWRRTHGRGWSHPHRDHKVPTDRYRGSACTLLPAHELLWYSVNSHGNINGKKERQKNRRAEQYAWQIFQRRYVFPYDNIPRAHISRTIERKRNIDVG